MTRHEALALIKSDHEITFAGLSDIFAAFGFVSYTTDNRTEVYHNEAWPNCWPFTARDEGLGVLTAEQRALVQGMLECVMFSESSTGGGS